MYVSMYLCLEKSMHVHSIHENVGWHDGNIGVKLVNARYALIDWVAGWLDDVTVFGGTFQHRLKFLPHSLFEKGYAADKLMASQDESCALEIIAFTVTYLFWMIID